MIGGLLLAAGILVVGAVAHAIEPSDAAYTFGSGPFAPAYTPPPPGTYELPPIQAIRDHRLLDEHGRETTLFDALGDRLGVVAFIYTHCHEAAGCPVSTAALHRLDRTLADDPELRDRVVLLTVSFDPARDTPARMRAERRLHEPRSRWRFLTTRDQAMLDPLLGDFGQRVEKLRRADGSWTGLFRHVLKVFLVDPARRVRNIYSTGFLDAELVANDLRTVVRATDGPT
jgi:cytochrome c peroxidase